MSLEPSRTPATNAVGKPAERSATGPTAIERLLAAAAHLLTLLSIPGLGVTLLIWLGFRHRSAYIAYHARRAIFWQIMSAVLLLVFVIVAAVVFVISLGGLVTSAQGTGEQLDLAGLLGSSLGIAIILLIPEGAIGVSAILGAITALLGWHYKRALVARKSKRS